MNHTTPLKLILNDSEQHENHSNEAENYSCNGIGYAEALDDLNGVGPASEVLRLRFGEVIEILGEISGRDPRREFKGILGVAKVEKGK